MIGQAPTHHLQRVVRCAIELFLPELRGRLLLLHEGNQSVVGVLTHITSRSSAIMSGLRKLSLFADEYDISIGTKYIRNDSNVWACRLRRETDNEDWQSPPASFATTQRKKKGNPLQGRHVKDIGSAWIYSPISVCDANVRCPGCVSPLPGTAIYMG